MAFGIMLGVKAILNDCYHHTMLIGLLLEECFRRYPRLLGMCLGMLRAVITFMASSFRPLFRGPLANYVLPTEQQHRTLLDDSPYAKRIAAVRNTLDAIPPEERGNATLHSPGIVLLGNRGCGKSSLMYALAQIPIHLSPTENDEPLPTRCPVQLNLRRTPGEAWRSVIWIYPRGQERYEFERTNEKRELLRLIRRAQTEVLARIDGNRVISENKIVVQIWGAETEFNIIEVPGIDEVLL
jgi:hypothetical protein